MIIWGWRSYIKTLGLVTFICGNCHNPAAQRVIRRITKFTLFFIPLFPVSSKYAVICSFCGMSSKVTKDEAENYVNVGSGQPGNGQPANAQPQPWGQQPAQLQPGQPAYGQQQPGPQGQQQWGQQQPAPQGQQQWAQQGGQPQHGQQNQPQHGQQNQPQHGQQNHPQSGPQGPQNWQPPLG